MHPIAERIGSTGVWYFTETMDAATAASFVQRVEELGYGTLWIPETMGRDPFAHGAFLLDTSERIIVATGIANIYHRHPGVMKQAQLTLSEQSGNRFLLGIGVSHAPVVAGLRNLDYSKPLTAMREYLTGMEASPYLAVGPDEEPAIVLAALGPKMLELAGTRADGALPYFTTPDHTVVARETMGEDAMLCVEQKVVRSTDPTEARAAARRALGTYIGLPNYFRNWLRLGYDEGDLADGGSDRLVDGLVAWGTEQQIEDRIQAHRDAGADHVCIQPVHPSGAMGEVDWSALEAFAPE